MERRKGLARRTALRQGDKGLKRSALGRGDKQLSRGEGLRTYSPLQASRKAKRPQAEVAASARWFQVLGQPDARGRPQRPCVQCGQRGDEVHHVIRQQWLEREVERPLGVSPVEVRWDLRCGVVLCERCHGRHTNAHSRVRVDKLPMHVGDWANELDDMLEAAGRPRIAMTELLREHPC